MLDKGQVEAFDVREPLVEPAVDSMTKPLPEPLEDLATDSVADLTDVLELFFLPFFDFFLPAGNNVALLYCYRLTALAERSCKYRSRKFHQK